MPKLGQTNRYEPKGFARATARRAVSPPHRRREQSEFGHHPLPPRSFAAGFCLGNRADWPETLPGECLTGTCFQIALEGDSLIDIRKSQVCDELPRHIFRSVGRAARIVPLKPRTQISGHSDIALPGNRDAFQKVHVAHEPYPGRRYTLTCKSTDCYERQANVRFAPGARCGWLGTRWQGIKPRVPRTCPPSPRLRRGTSSPQVRAAGGLPPEARRAKGGGGGWIRTSVRIAGRFTVCWI